MIHRLWKPWYVYRPTQIIRRALAAISPPASGFQPVTTSWGVTMWADPTKTVGQNIVVAGIYDLALSEILARLIQSGDMVLDVGANVGYTTLIAALAAGPSGNVIAFEPHPELFAILEQNVSAIDSNYCIAKTEIHNSALGENSGTANLWVPPQFGTNDGTSQIISNNGSGADTISVKMETIDDVLVNRSASVVKIDVEGFELQVLRGARRALESRRIRHIIFEDHNIGKSEVVQMLTEAGFTILSIGWSMRGIRLSPVKTGSLAKGLEAPNFVASIQPDEVVALCQPRGWLMLSKRLAKGRIRSSKLPT